MKVTFSIEWLFFIIPLFVLIWKGQKQSAHSGFMGSARDWYYMFMTPIALVVSFASWAIYLKFVK